MKIREILGIVTIIVAMGASGCVATDPGKLGSDAPNLRQAVTVKSGAEALVSYMVIINPDCSTTIPPTMRVLEQPKHGKLRIGFSKFPVAIPPSHKNYHCNGRTFSGAVALYRSDPGYVGPDRVKMANTGYEFGQTTNAIINVVK